jgi:hypothetical protein
MMLFSMQNLYLFVVSAILFYEYIYLNIIFVID